MSNVGDLIARRGEDVEIYRRTESGTDEFNRPEYTWSLEATEKAFIQPVGYTTGVGEVVLESGERVTGDHIGYFSPDSIIQWNDQVVWDGIRLDVKAVRVHRDGGSTRFYDVILERMVE